MRKLYFLAFLVIGLILKTSAQDSAHFNFTVGPNNVASFTNLSTISGPEPRKAHWVYGDGTKQITPPLANTTHQFPPGTGVYTVCLKIYKYWNNDSAVTSSVCKVVSFQNTTIDSCKANFTDTTATVSPLIKSFVAQPWHTSNKKPEQVCWNFGDGTTQACINYNPALNNTYNTSHTYSQAGTYNVCVKITYQGGCIANYCRTIQVGGDSCKADYNVEPVAASPHSRHFVAQPWHVQQKKPLKICWQFNDGTPDTCIFYTTASTGPYFVNHTFTNYGTYNVCTKIFYDGGCEAIKCKPVVVTAPSTDSCNVNLFEAATDINNPVRQFYLNTSTGLAVHKICWYFGDGTDSCREATTTSPVPLTMTHQYPSPGNYNLCVKVWYTNGCIVQKCKNVNIASNTNLCGGYMTDSLTGPKTYKFKGFNINTPNDYVVSWKWSFGDGSPIANGQTVTHTYVNGGTYQLCLTIVTHLGCETKICKAVQVAGNAQPAVTISPNPVTSTLNLNFVSTLQQSVNVTIYNNNGVAVGNYVMNAFVGTNNWNISVVNLPPGIYSVVVHSPNQYANATFIKQ
jgi:PKD repeat protein